MYNAAKVADIILNGNLLNNSIDTENDFHDSDGDISDFLIDNLPVEDESVSENKESSSEGENERCSSSDDLLPEVYDDDNILVTRIHYDVRQRRMWCEIDKDDVDNAVNMPQ